MKNTILGISILAAMVSSNVIAMNKVNNEATLKQAIAEANANAGINKIMFAENAEITLTAPVVYNGSQSLTIIGKGATIDGSSAGSFVLDSDLTAITEDGTLVFNTAADITLQDLNVENSATRGIVVNVPEGAEGDDITITLQQVNVRNSALYGLHIDDNADEFDDGVSGSSIGIDLNISHSNFIGNGTGAIDFDGIRVDERAEGDINAVILHTRIDANGGDGIELDEAGDGKVEARMRHVAINDNGFFNEEDLDDGFDIDEADDGDIEVTLFKVQINNNMDEGLDFDEEGDGDVELDLRRVMALNNSDEGIKVDEEDAGNIDAKLKKVQVIDAGDDGIQFTEIGEGKIEVALKKVKASNNAKFGIKIEQWFVEDENVPVEEPGSVKTRNVLMSGNGNGDEIEVNNVNVE